MRVTLVDAAVFAAEVTVYVSVARAAWSAAPGVVSGSLAAACTVLAMATWWGLLHAPRAPLHAPQPLDLALRITWFGVGLLAAATALADRLLPIS